MNNKILKSKKLLFGISIISTIAMLCGCGAPKDTSIASIQQRGVIKVAVPATESNLLYFDEDGNYAGMEDEIVDVIAEALNVSVEYLPGEDENFVSKINTGEADIAIGSIVYDSTLHSGNTYSTVYGGDYIYLVTQRGVYVGDLSVFKGKTLGAANSIPSISRSEIYAIEDATIVDYNNVNSVRAALDRGEIAGYFCYQREAEQLIADGQYQVINAAGIDREEYVILAPGNSNALMNGINVLVKQYLNGDYVKTEQTEESEDTENN